MSETINYSVINLPTHTDSINQVEQLVEQLKESHKINEDIFGNILVALTEAVNNAILHGNKSDSNKSIELGYSIQDSLIQFYVQDQGVGFNFHSIPDPTNPNLVDQPNGRGIFLMKHLCDQLIFSDEGRMVELYFKIA